MPRKLLLAVALILFRDLWSYHCLWVGAWLWQGQPFAVALIAPLAQGELFKVAGGMWLIATYRLIKFAMSMERNRKLWATLMYTALAVLPALTWATLGTRNFSDPPTQRVELITICVMMVLSALSYALPRQRPSLREIELSPHLLRAPRIPRWQPVRFPSIFLGLTAMVLAATVSIRLLISPVRAHVHPPVRQVSAVEAKAAHIEHELRRQVSDSLRPDNPLGLLSTTPAACSAPSGNLWGRNW